MKRKKETIAITAIGSLVIILLIVIGLIISNVIKDGNFIKNEKEPTTEGVGIGEKIESDKGNSSSEGVVDIEEIAYEEVRYYAFEGENNLWGYVDENLEEVIAPKFRYAKDFSNGVAVVMGENKYGYIDKTGEFVIEEKFEIAKDFSDGVAIVEEVYESSEKTIINLKGEVVGSFDSKYHYEEFQNGTAVIDDGDKYGLINKKGEIILKTENEYIEDSYNGIRVVEKKDDKYFYINSNGKILNEEYAYDLESFNDGYGIIRDRNYNATIIDKNGDIIKVDSKYRVVGISKEGIVVYDDSLKSGLIGFNGEEVIKLKYEELSNFTDGIAIAECDDGKLIAINSKDEQLFEVDKIYKDSMWKFENGICIVSDINGKRGIINNKGEVVLEMQNISIFKEENFLEVENRENTNEFAKIYNTSGKLIFESDKKYYKRLIDENMIKINFSAEQKAMYMNKDGKSIEVKY